MTRDDREAARANDAETPPLGSWTRLYLLVIAWLAVEIALLVWLTRTAHG